MPASHEFAASLMNPVITGFQAIGMEDADRTAWILLSRFEINGLARFPHPNPPPLERGQTKKPIIFYY